MGITVTITSIAFSHLERLLFDFKLGFKFVSSNEINSSQNEQKDYL